MGLFGFKKEGGFMDVIRCDEPEYLFWKWRPSGNVNSTRKENSIRYGSRLRVKAGEVAAFFYKQDDLSVIDYIEGPYDGTLKTANLPILTSIISLAYSGDSPFQADIYFINLAENIQIKFGIPFFDIFDARFLDLGIPCAVRGTITFNITDYKNFIKLNHLINFDLDDLKNQVQDFLTRRIKSTVLNVPAEEEIPVIQIERKIEDINEVVYHKLKEEVQEHFGINFKRLDIGAIELQKDHPNYLQLKKATADQKTKLAEAKADLEILNLEEISRIQRKDIELNVEGKNLNVHQLNKQVDVLKTAAENLGQMSNVDLGGAGMNPAGMMAGMAIGVAMGGQMAGMMGSVNQQVPPPLPQIVFHVSINGHQSGPFNLEQLKGFVQTGQFTKLHYVWREGMPGWELASNVPELATVFSTVPPPPPVLPPA